MEAAGCRQHQRTCDRIGAGQAKALDIWRMETKVEVQLRHTWFASADVADLRCEHTSGPRSKREDVGWISCVDFDVLSALIKLLMDARAEGVPGVEER